MPEQPVPPDLADIWPTFIAEDLHRPGLDGLFSHPRVFPLQRRRELEAMLARAAKVNPSTLLIVGIDKGGDAYAFLKSLPGLRMIIGIEPRGCPWKTPFSEAFPRVQFVAIEASSYAETTIRDVRQHLACDPIDVAFLDGDKSGFDRDIAAYMPMMRPGGVMFLHDCMSHDRHAFPCAEVFRKLSRQRPTELIVDTREHDEEYERELRGEKPRSAHAGWLRHWRTIPTCGVGVIPI